MQLFKTATIAFGLALIPAIVSAEPYDLDKSHAHVTFSVMHLGFSHTQGEFKDFDAEIDFDPEAPETSSVSFTIQAASVDTNWPKRDAHIKKADFLDVENHPEITFVSRSVEVDGETAKITGDFTLLGQTHEETFEARLTRVGNNPFVKAPGAGFVVEGVIDRAKYGNDTYARLVDDNPIVATKIPFRVDLEITAAK